MQMTTAIRRVFRRVLRALRAQGTYDDPAFVERMQAARRYGVEQKRASIDSQRAMKQQRANRVEAAYLYRGEGDR